MSGYEETAYEEAAYEEAASVFNSVKVFFEEMNGSEYESVQRMVVHLRECMDLLYWKNGETWKADKGWSERKEEYMELVTGELNECYAEYEAENSCDLDWFWYAGFVDLLDKCRMWMRKLINEDPEWKVMDGMELEPIRRVTKEQYERRGRVRAEVREYGAERLETIADLRREISELRDRVDKLERVKVENSWFPRWGRKGTNVGSCNNVYEVDTKTLLCRLSEMNLERVSKDTLRLEI
jgi:hypothetical protein